MLISREPDDTGLWPSWPYDGGPFDESQFRLIKGGWDHDHCGVCLAKVEPGDEWWANVPPDQGGLCLECHARLFGNNDATQRDGQ
jgi:hypothetical protein